MLTGSFASAVYGKSRSTNDIDFVISATPDQLKTLHRYLPPEDYYSDLESALVALKSHSMFNVLDMKTGMKIDFIVRKPDTYSRQALERRTAVSIHGVRTFVSTAEDVVLSKLGWAKIGESVRQIQDVAGILQVQSASLDHEYLNHWLGELGLESQWQAALQMSGI